MAYLNKIQLIGNVGKTPEVRTFDGGNKVANFTLATTKRYTDRNGQLVDATTWHNIQVNGKVADVAEKYVQKGDPLFVTGEMTYRKYQDRDGNNRSIPEVRVLSLQLLPKGIKDGADTSGSARAPQAPAPAADRALNAGLVNPQESEEDLPF